MNEKSIIVIPARYDSVRFPGKVLADLNGKPIVQWVYERASLADADAVYVATDHAKVAELVEGFGGRAIITSSDHPSGTDRIHEAIQSIEGDIIINVQGDEPLIVPEEINKLIDLMRKRPETEMATIAVPASREDLANNPNLVKVVLDTDNNALYFSRSMLPFLREGGEETRCLRHWGIYAYRRNFLEKFVSLPEGALEKCEKLEQLRAMENGVRIQVAISEFETVGIDTPEDLEYASKIMKNMSL